MKLTDAFLLLIAQIFYSKIILFLEPAVIPEDPCNPSPCGANAQCNNGICTCLPEYQGDPYTGCRPECVYNTDCPRDKACVRNKCIDPCPGTCGQNAQCTVYEHVPMCTCLPGFTGNSFIICTEIRGIILNFFKCNPSNF